MEEVIKKIEFSNRVFILLAILVVVIAFYQFQSLPQNYPQEITVTGEGKTFVKPDIALVSLGVQTEARSSVDAVNHNNEKMNAIIKAIKESGVEEKDIKTSLYNLSPVYDYPQQGRVFKGYSLDQQIQVKIRNFDKISEILDKATANGANTIGDLQFTVDDMEKVRAMAREEAIKQAKEKAVNLSKQSGLRLVKLVNILEGFAPVPQPLYEKSVRTLEAIGGAAPDIQPGQSEITTTVYLTYRVK